MKGFKDKSGKFRPTGNRKKSSITKDDVKKKNKFGQSTEAIENQHSIAIKRNKKTISSTKPSAEESFDLGNENDEKYWNIKNVTAYPEIDDIVVPVKFAIQTFNQEAFEYNMGDSDDEREDYKFDRKNEYYDANLYIIPEKLGKEHLKSLLRSSGLNNESEITPMDSIIDGSAILVEEFSEEGEQNAVNSAMKDVQAVAGLIGFTLDKYVNQIGETGWDRLGEIALDREAPSFKEILARRES